MWAVINITQIQGRYIPKKGLKAKISTKIQVVCKTLLVQEYIKITRNQKLRYITEFKYKACTT